MNETIKQQIREIAEQPQNRHSAIVILPLFDTSIAELQQEGREIPRSNHLGNDYPSNQAFVNCLERASFNLYDRTTLVDQNYFPGSLFRGGNRYEIADVAPVMSPFLQPNDEFFKQLAHLPAELHRARTPVQLHYLSQKMLHPNSTTYSEWILKNAEKIRLTANIAASSSHYDIFDREIDETGTIRKGVDIGYKNSGQAIIDSAQILAEAVSTGNTNIPTPFFLHRNEFNLYLDAVINSSRPENQVDIDGERWGLILHGAGPDMIKYATSLWRTLGILHESAAPRLAEMGVPRKIIFGLVPTAELKLSLPDTEAETLERLAEALIYRESSRIISRDPDLSDYDKSVLAIIDTSSREAIRKLSAETRVSEIAFLQPFSNHYSQYDLLPNGKIHFPQKLHSVSFRLLREFNNRLGQNLKKRVQK